MYTLYIEDIHGGQTHEHAFDDGELVIGRSREVCDIVLPADNVSRRHARLYTADRLCYIQDLGSANGVFVDGVRIRDVQELESSSRVRVGDYVLHVGYHPTTRAPRNTLARLISTASGGTAPVHAVLEPVTLIGRGKDTAVTIIDPSVSRVHAKLTVENDERFVLQDLRSANGTWINERRVEQSPLSFGDRVRFGNAEFHFESAESSDSPLATAYPSQVSVELQTATPSFPPEDSGQARRWVLPFLLVFLLATAGVLALLLVETRKPEGAAQAPASAAEPLDEPPPPTPPVAAPDPETLRREALSRARDEARRARSERRWRESEESWKIVLGHEPEDSEAARSLHEVREERDSAARLSEARSLRGAHDYAAALITLAAIPRSSVYHLESLGLTTEIRALVPGYLEAALRAQRAGDWPTACDSLARVIDIDPNPRAIPRSQEKNVRRLKRKCARRAKTDL